MLSIKVMVQDQGLIVVGNMVYKVSVAKEGGILRMSGVFGASEALTMGGIAVTGGSTNLSGIIF